MAKNREPEKPVESDPESDDNDDDGESSSAATGSGSESESESEPDQTQITKKPPSSPPPTTTKKPQPHSSSKPKVPSSSGSDSDSDGPDPNIKPLATKPMEPAPHKPTAGARKPNPKPKPKPTASDFVTPAKDKSSAGKRPAEEKETEAKDAKRSKKKAEPETSEKKSTDDSKKQLFQRIWSEGDEIAILEGMIDYVAKKKSDPLTDLNAFHEFIKKNLHVDVSKVQLQDKIRRLRKKHANNRSKEKEGKDRTFSKPHEQKAYELSKVIWGNEGVKEEGVEKVVGSPKANGALVVRKAPSKNEDVKDVKIVEAADGDSEIVLTARRSGYGGVCMEEMVLRIGEELFEDGKGLEGADVWKKLKTEKIEAHLKNLEVQTKQTRLVLSTLKSAGR